MTKSAKPAGLPLVIFFFVVTGPVSLRKAVIEARNGLFAAPPAVLSSPPGPLVRFGEGAGMIIIFFLIPLSIIIASVFLIAFIWAVRTGQYRTPARLPCGC